MNRTIRSITATERPTCRPEDSKADILDRFNGGTLESAATTYVLDRGIHIGRIDVATLHQSPDGTTASLLMEPAEVRLCPDSDRERAIHLAITGNHDELPVVDENGRFVGAVTSQAIIDAMHREHADDLFLRAGIQKTGLRVADLACSRLRVAVRIGHYGSCSVWSSSSF